MLPIVTSTFRGIDNRIVNKKFLTWLNKKPLAVS